ncbi:hypothetical protein GLOTRDRAFT_92556 [Gloeophyllum trabeum ATCC 11539]|uniref:RING-type E3 ubiquitin transferase n=1 Tax=Gloeophyllum trabeum (strain ATCC 11539 / FP-39264 / Madison 617) TaxID=670483 RepID=S7QCE8_GLOTA|nr:uncharacterized protein GLOTRDRAFT_92556 [Gloeophyllum trabeum ATCC 11539]EPQ57556.1 hypothetical protein GLOTRDRAFT_92556 [Gloeophyllum trabeum ATCC 11539]
MALTSHFFLYSILSTVAVSAAVLNALKNYSNFYSVAIYLSRSSRSVLILVNFGFLLALLCGRMMQRIFLGPLQTREVERLYDRLWFFVTESLLAFTIFRDEFDMPFAFMFGLLLFIKCFHWLMADRIDTMDQVPYPGPPPVFHVRMNCLCALLAFTDMAMFVFAVESTLAHGIGGNLLFASEYAILMASALNSMAKYVLSVVDLRRARSRGGAAAPPWENKSMYVFYIELATDFLKLTTYLTFCGIIVTFYGLPLNVLRDVYLTSRSFITRLRALVRYRTATRNMDERYPNATEEEMNAMSDRTCIICREEMSLSNTPPPPGESGANAAEPQGQIPDGPNMTPKKLPCGHIFHFHCLRSWLERQQSCPTCRRTVLETNPQGAQPGQAAARPPGPQPGMIPIPDNFFGPAGGQQIPPQGQQPPQANAPGFFGRIFGAAQQPPIVPGQFAEGVRMEPLPLQWNQQQQPLYYQQNPQQRPLQAVPIFQGFPGPNGIWQPWGVDQRWFQPELPGQVPAAQEQPPPTRTTQAPAPQHDNTNHLGDGPSAPGSAAPGGTASEPERAITPREAAVQAALRRFNGGTPRPETLTSDSRASSSNNITSASTPGPSDLQGTNGQQTSDDSTGLNIPATGTSNGDDRMEIPKLIPILSPPPFPGATSSYVPYNPNAPVGSQRTAYPAPDRSSQTRLPRPLAQTPIDEIGRSRRPRIPFTRLPETLTEEQLTRLDQITRDAIDERIRVLEGVSGTVSRCVEELLRVRSVLPSVQAALRDNQGPTQNLRENFAASSSSRDAASSSSASSGQRSTAGPDVAETLLQLRDEVLERTWRTSEQISEVVSGGSARDPSQPHVGSESSDSEED